MLLEDADQSIYAAGESEDPRALPQRCARMSLLAINTGIEMGLSDKEVIQLGTAGLLHDLGLYLMPAHFRDPTTELTANEVWEYRQTPFLGHERVCETFDRHGRGSRDRESGSRTTRWQWLPTGLARQPDPSVGEHSRDRGFLFDFDPTRAWTTSRGTA